MRVQNPFAGVGTTGLDSQVLMALARARDYLIVDEIHRLLPEGGSPQGVRNSLDRLVAQGTVSERVQGRTRAYALNRDHLLADAILQIASTKAELISRMAQTVSTWPATPRTVTLFGSAARGDMETSSDIDVLIVLPDSAVDDPWDEAVDTLSRNVSRWTGNDVRPLVYYESEVHPAGVFDSILREGIPIAGDPTWLRRRLARVRASA